MVATIPSASQLVAASGSPLLFSSRGSAPKPAAFTGFTWRGVLPGVSLVRIAPEPLTAEVPYRRLYVASKGSCWEDVPLYDRTYGRVFTPALPAIASTPPVSVTPGAPGVGTIETAAITDQGYLGSLIDLSEDNVTWVAVGAITTVAAGTVTVSGTIPAPAVAYTRYRISEAVAAGTLTIQPPDPFVFRFDFSRRETCLYVEGAAGVHIFGSPLLSLDGSPSTDEFLNRLASHNGF